MTKKQSVQRIPETESMGRIHTSTVSIAILPEVEEIIADLNPKDLKIDTFRASGAGGQHVNKTESAVRITHLPTGVSVAIQDERSQKSNKERAMKILKAKIFEANIEKQEKERNSQRQQQVS